MSAADLAELNPYADPGEFVYDPTIRDEAIKLVDRRHGYTKEFAPSPEAHADEWDEEEIRLHRERLQSACPSRSDVDA